MVCYLSFAAARRHRCAIEAMCPWEWDRCASAQRPEQRANAIETLAIGWVVYAQMVLEYRTVGGIWHYLLYCCCYQPALPRKRIEGTETSGLRSQKLNSVLPPTFPLLFHSKVLSKQALSTSMAPQTTEKASQQESEPPNKRRRVGLACNACRVRKSR